MGRKEGRVRDVNREGSWRREWTRKREGCRERERERDGREGESFCLG